MPTITAGDFRNGVTFEKDGERYAPWWSSST